MKKILTFNLFILNCLFAIAENTKIYLVSKDKKIKKELTEKEFKNSDYIKTTIENDPSTKELDVPLFFLNDPKVIDILVQILGSDSQTLNIQKLIDDNKITLDEIILILNESDHLILSKDLLNILMEGSQNYFTESTAENMEKLLTQLTPIARHLFLINFIGSWVTKDLSKEGLIEAYNSRLGQLGGTKYLLPLALLVGNINQQSIVVDKDKYNTFSRSGRTTLMALSKNSHKPEWIRFALKNGAQVNLKDKGNETALDYAIQGLEANRYLDKKFESDQQKIVEILKKSGAKTGVEVLLDETKNLSENVKIALKKIIDLNIIWGKIIDKSDWKDIKNKIKKIFADNINSIDDAISLINVAVQIGISRPFSLISEIFANDYFSQISGKNLHALLNDLSKRTVRSSYYFEFLQGLVDPKIASKIDYDETHEVEKGLSQAFLNQDARSAFALALILDKFDSQDQINKEAPLNRFNYQDPINKETVLMIAAAKDQTNIVEFLLDKGALVNLVDKNNRTALDKATKKEIVNLLKTAGAKTGKEINKKE